LILKIKEMRLADFFDLGARVLRSLDPETAHKITINALKTGLARPLEQTTPSSLATKALGLKFSSPLGLAAGYDKNAEVANGFLRFGVGFVEVGTITLRPQAGNPKPRLFRLASDRAVINRMGFNNKGLHAAAYRLAKRNKVPGIVAANIGPNRDSQDAPADCAQCARTLAPLADFLVVNVSSPNTPGLREMQNAEPLDELVQAVLGARDESGWPTPVVVKIAPDLDPSGCEAIARVVLDRSVDGLVVSNTSTGLRDGLTGTNAGEAGGLSGDPLFALSTQVLADMYRLTEGRVTLIGVGGISSGADAYAKIRAGASLTELYTALVYNGPGLIQRIHNELAALLKQDGFSSVAEAVGTASQPQ
jgi:dihydroorotate dehydrogenase